MEGTVDGLIDDFDVGSFDGVLVGDLDGCFAVGESVLIDDGLDGALVEGLIDGFDVGRLDGALVGNVDGRKDCFAVGERVGIGDGLDDEGALVEGIVDGATVILSDFVEAVVGSKDGTNVGFIVGPDDTAIEGAFVGSLVGWNDGLKEGPFVGSLVSSSVGFDDGALVGAESSSAAAVHCEVKLKVVKFPSLPSLVLCELVYPAVIMFVQDTAKSRMKSLWAARPAAVPSYRSRR